MRESTHAPVLRLPAAHTTLALAAAAPSPAKPTAAVADAPAAAVRDPPVHRRLRRKDTLGANTHQNCHNEYRKYAKLKYDRPAACADTDESASLPLPGLAESELTPSAPDTVAAPNCRDVLVRSQSVHMPFFGISTSTPTET